MNFNCWIMCEYGNDLLLFISNHIIEIHYWRIYYFIWILFRICCISDLLMNNFIIFQFDFYFVVCSMIVRSNQIKNICNQRKKNGKRSRKWWIIKRYFYKKVIHWYFHAKKKMLNVMQKKRRNVWNLVKNNHVHKNTKK